MVERYRSQPACDREFGRRRRQLRPPGLFALLGKEHELKPLLPHIREPSYNGRLDQLRSRTRGGTVDVNPTIQHELLAYVGQLGSEDQVRVVDFARQLARSPIRGTPGKDLLKFAGCIPHEDLEEMKKAIEEDCERIDADEW